MLETKTKRLTPAALAASICVLAPSQSTSSGVPAQASGSGSGSGWGSGSGLGLGPPGMSPAYPPSGFVPNRPFVAVPTEEGGVKKGRLGHMRRGEGSIASAVPPGLKRNCGRPGSARRSTVFLKSSFTCSSRGDSEALRGRRESVADLS